MLLTAPRPIRYGGILLNAVIEEAELIEDAYFLQGAGAGQATEDALFLARLLGSPNVSKASTPEKLQKALELYQKYRHERAAQVQITSAQAGLLYEGRGVKGEGQDFDKVKANLDDRMKWIWDYDIEGNVKSMLAEAEKL